MSVCLSARITQKQHDNTSRIFLYMLPVAVARSFSDTVASCFHNMPLSKSTGWWRRRTAQIYRSVLKAGQQLAMLRATV